MIELKNIIVEDKEGFIIHRGEAIKRNLKNIDIVKYNNDKFYELSIKKEEEDKIIIKLLTSSFSAFLKYKKSFLPFELELKTIPVDGEIIANFSPIFRIRFDGQIAEIWVDLIYIELFGLPPHISSSSKWSTNYILSILKDINIYITNFQLYQDDNRNRYGIRFVFKNEDLISDCLKIVSGFLKDIERELVLRINSFQWKEIYSKNELMFNEEVLLPLLRKMKLDNIRYTHGTDELGKDFIFSLRTKFNDEIHFAIQAKAGDLSGSANKKIEELINQVKIATKNPFYKIADESQHYIAIVIIAISGKFTNQAEKRLINELPVEYKGSVKFWDKQKILALVEKYWIE